MLLGANTDVATIVSGLAGWLRQLRMERKLSALGVTLALSFSLFLSLSLHLSYLRVYPAEHWKGVCEKHHLLAYKMGVAIRLAKCMKCPSLNFCLGGNIVCSQERQSQEKSHRNGPDVRVRPFVQNWMCLIKENETNGFREAG
ncbi:unnamed protein product [Protopolystoma xenopodis]|uniref:Uncharacterized protein n=1 Tax=Protopolystoma xenopodis TaxID=117903 RepID=A0A448WSD5_9PLAT|nr:unnamed protein product [Protopolystoma xenopodis]